jgi:hypothetical protein
LMNTDSINKWLSLIANLGVLIGIIFLSIQIGQANRIAERDGRSSLVSQYVELHTQIIESPEFTELMVKLSNPNAELTAQETVKARSLSPVLINWAANLNISYESDLVSGEPIERQFGAITNIMRSAPGIVPFLEESMAPRGTMVFFDRVWDEIERLK